MSKPEIRADLKALEPISEIIGHSIFIFRGNKKAEEIKWIVRRAFIKGVMSFIKKDILRELSINERNHKMLRFRRKQVQNGQIIGVISPIV